ncbi:MAG: hypothetical protein H6964_12425 [Chromatiaceae bacterium]|nr:hypothetical protein [Gammaproteobacteria bacterium]MCB1879651.1 hypothetical protein [Gammaproteobacteria bacterium]MCP5427379.1 hypothetical protein [Chromatiaceae bacterium]MCP5447784.1 hypothetical protein [Chromatiaceae bacterium]
MSESGVMFTGSTQPLRQAVFSARILLRRRACIAKFRALGRVAGAAMLLVRSSLQFFQDAVE